MFKYIANSTRQSVFKRESLDVFDTNALAIKGTVINQIFKIKIGPRERK